MCEFEPSLLAVLDPLIILFMLEGLSIGSRISPIEPQTRVCQLTCETMDDQEAVLTIRELVEEVENARQLLPVKLKRPP